MSWILAFVGFALLIILHELGHFAAAKAVGMRVERFALFFPPLLWTVKRGETEYGIGAVPLGGYVKITGMNPAEEIPPEHAHRAYYKQPVWKRLVVIGAGPAMNVLVAFVILFVLFAVKGDQVANNKVGDVAPKSAAVGVLQAGRPARRRRRRQGRARGPAHEHRQAHLRRQRQGRGLRRRDARPASPSCATAARRCSRSARATARPTSGCCSASRSAATTTASRLGESASRSVTGMWDVTKATVDTVGKLFYDESARKELSGVVGSYETTRQSFAADDIERALRILALISLSLAIVNLFPFLPLDGGHIFWALAEKVRGRPIPFRIMEQASYVGFVLVLMLFAVGLTNDIGRLQDGGFGVK